jgi:hypothetical protein
VSSPVTPRARRQRDRAADRRKVRSRNPRPRRHRRRAKQTGVLAALGFALTAIFMATGMTAAAVGSVATAAGSSAVSYIEYRRDLREVKRTGRPIGAPEPKPEPPPKQKPARKPRQRARPKPKPPPTQQPQPEPEPEPEPERPPDPEPIDLDNPKGGAAPPPSQARQGRQLGPRTSHHRNRSSRRRHEPECQARSADTCKCPPGRKGAKRERRAK